ncbi:MAG TPA: alanine racemase [Chthoniobacterales bacterium]
MNANDAHRCWVEIDTTALRHNAYIARARVGPAVELMGVIKANGYGHGLAAVAKALADQAQSFGVANLREAVEARTVVPHPLLILGPALPEERKAITEGGFIASISSASEAQEFARAANGKAALVNCAIDTGMGRMGIAEVHAIDELRRIASLPQVEIHSISTHLPSSDEEPEFTREQLQHFTKLVAAIREQIPGRYKVHALSSGGVLGFCESCFDIVRAGLMLYGVSPAPEFQAGLRAPLTWKSHIVLVREVAVGTSVSYGRTWFAQRPTRIATLSVGYADGYPRSLSGRGASVLVRGRRCPVIGRVTMDLTMVDVTDVSSVNVGDEVVLLGRDGAEEISARELAERAGTIAWEIFTGIGSRVARVYV